MFSLLWGRFRKDERGNVAIIFAAALLPILCITGAVIDYKRAVDARGKLLSSLDGALLALGRSPMKSDADAQTFVETYVAAQLDSLGYTGSWSLTDFDQSAGRLSADVSGAVETALLGLVGVEEVGFDTSSAVVREQKKVELALVLDNTGSMGSHGRIDDLREAATALVNILYASDTSAERVKLALVPFVTGVNIRASSFSMDWMDTEGRSAFHGVNFDTTITEDDGDNRDDDHDDDDRRHRHGPGIGSWGGDRWDTGSNSASSGSSATGGALPASVSTAAASQMIGEPSNMIGQDGGGDGGGDADNAEPVPANHFALFDLIANADWKGCVEARAEPYDTDDTPPGAAEPNTLWVPWFWPDEPDRGRSYANDYLDDGIESDDDDILQAYVGKYDGSNASIDESPSNTSGPNKSCGQAIRPLTDDKQVLLDDIDEMRHWNGSGTDIAQGLVWGWRVLSPGEPFTEGVPYEDEETMKAIVLLSDGENVVVNQSNDLNESDYNPYNYLSHGRLGTTNTYTAAERVDEKVAAICEKAKDKNIRIYTILFDLDSESLRTLFRTCATSEGLYFDNPSPDELGEVFQEIAYDLSNLRLEK